MWSAKWIRESLCKESARWKKRSRIPSPSSAYGHFDGDFGLVAWRSLESVAQRTHEIGIRLALDADPRDLMKLILGQALKLTGIGLVIAVPCAVAISRAMASLIFGVVSVDFTILGGFTALLLLVALGAGYLPARRAIASTRWILCATNSGGYL